MTKKFIFLLLLMFTGLQIMQAQQTYSIKGIVKDAANGEPVSFANVVIWNTIEGTVTDSIGQFEITGVSSGSYRLQASFIGYKPTVTAEFRISNKDMFLPSCGKERRQCSLLAGFHYFLPVRSEKTCPCWKF